MLVTFPVLPVDNFELESIPVAAWGQQLLRHGDGAQTSTLSSSFLRF